MALKDKMLHKFANEASKTRQSEISNLDIKYVGPLSKCTMQYNVETGIDNFINQ